MNRRDFIATTAGLATVAMATALPEVAVPPCESVPFDELLPFEGTTRRIRCRWEDRYRVANELIGRRPGPGDVVFSSTPQEHPRQPGLFTSEIEITGEGPEVWASLPDTGYGMPSPSRLAMIGFRYALIVVRYAKPEFILGMT